MLNITDIYYGYYEMWEPADPRLRQFKSIDGGPWLILVLTAIYVIVARVVGPRLMSNRDPPNLTLALFVYNVTMVAINLTIFCRTSVMTRFGTDTWGCSPFGRHSPNDESVVYECFLLGKCWWRHFRR